MKPIGAVACGHPETVKAAELILKEGGNAFDAILAAHFTACVVEPVLASLGGGGFLLAHTESRKNVIYDFFAHTPITPLPQSELDFYPIHADFGTTTQEFHIGLASIATPGAVKGIFKIHQDLCSMPMREIAQPAIESARKGISVNAFQSYIFDVVNPIFTATAESKQQYQSVQDPSHLITEGEILIQSHMANIIEALAIEGDDLFYKGEIAKSICAMCSRGGGQINEKDLANYEVILRNPISVNYGQNVVYTNTAPSCGGTLIAFALNLLEHLNIGQYRYGSSQHIQLLTEVMKLTNEARSNTVLNSQHQSALAELLDQDLLRIYRTKIANNVRSLRGTTHMNVMDNQGNIASLTVSNGEGCGHIIPDTGIMLNNMLGEEDLNPGGFHNWPANKRMTSMMAPTLVLDKNGRYIALGSGGSNRLRTAILQVLINVLDYSMELKEAVNSPRLHFENTLLSIEPGFEKEELGNAINQFANHKLWEEKNLFFGGVHAIQQHQSLFSGAGDTRRGGVALIVT